MHQIDAILFAVWCKQKYTVYRMIARENVSSNWIPLHSPSLHSINYTSIRNAYLETTINWQWATAASTKSAASSAKPKVKNYS